MNTMQYTFNLAAGAASIDTPLAGTAIQVAALLAALGLALVHLYKV